MTSEIWIKRLQPKIGESKCVGMEIMMHIGGIFWDHCSMDGRSNAWLSNLDLIDD